MRGLVFVEQIREWFKKVLTGNLLDQRGVLMSSTNRNNIMTHWMAPLLDSDCICPSCIRHILWLAIADERLDVFLLFGGGFNIALPV